MREITMRVLRHAFVLSLMILSGCSFGPGIEESLVFGTLGEWDHTTAVTQEVPGKYFSIEQVRKGDDFQNWYELLTMQNFARPWGGATPAAALEELKAVHEKRCPGVTVWNVIEQDEASIFYEWQARMCAGWAEQHELARICYGVNNVWLMRYTVKEYTMTAEQREEMLKTLRSARVVTEPSS